MSNRQYDFTLAAALGASARIDAMGSKLRVLVSPAGGVGVKIDGGPEIQLLEGQGFNMQPGKTFRDVIVRNLQAVANAGSIFIGDEGFEDSRITGVVSVVDANRNDVSAGKAFTLTSSFGGTAATYAAIGLWNPAGSGKNAVVTEVSVSVAAATSVQLGLITVAPTSLDSATNNKMLNGAAADPVKRAYQEYALSNPATFLRIYTWLGVTSANKVFQRPIIVPPGYGLLGINQTAAQQLSVNLEWTNESL